MKFYAEIFGWQFQAYGEAGDYFLTTTGPQGEPGIDGAIMRSRAGQARTINTISVASVDETLAKVLALGGELALPKQVIPGVGYVAYCKDPEGAIFGIYESDPGAQ
jgi:predicted enzyme related to lactoylglutathione lyase